MTIYILWFCLLCLIFLLLKQLNIKANIIICTLISFFIILFIANINLCIDAAIKGCVLWYRSVLPTTFPFVVICNLLIYYDGINVYSKLLGPLLCKPLNLSTQCSFPLIASILCGYPLGAKYCNDLYSMKYVDREEYLRLLNIASNVGPIFLLGAVGVTMLHNIVYGYLLLISSYLSILFIGLITKKNRTINNNSSYLIKKASNYNIGTALKQSVENAISTILSIGGFIILFSIIICLCENTRFIVTFFYNIEHLLSLPRNSLYSLFLGSIEITNGCSIISSIDIPISIKLASISFLCSFSGFAIIAQVSSFVSDSNINYKRYLSLKFIQGIFSALFTFILSKFLPLSVLSSAFNTISIVNNYNIWYYILLLVLIMLYTFSRIISRLFLHSS